MGWLSAFVHFKRCNGLEVWGLGGDWQHITLEGNREGEGFGKKDAAH